MVDMATLVLIGIPVFAALIVILDDGTMHTAVKSQQKS